MHGNSSNMFYENISTSYFPSNSAIILSRSPNQSSLGILATVTEVFLHVATISVILNGFVHGHSPKYKE